VYLVVLFQCCEIFTRLGEFSFLHTLTHIPVDESALRVHEIELVVKAGPGFGDGGGVAEHGHAAVDRGELTAGNADGPGRC
jgi:hypothetical protein